VGAGLPVRIPNNISPHIAHSDDSSTSFPPLPTHCIVPSFSPSTFQAFDPFFCNSRPHDLDIIEFLLEFFNMWLEEVFRDLDTSWWTALDSGRRNYMQFIGEKYKWQSCH
jgi:hypothetical protein